MCMLYKRAIVSMVVVLCSLSAGLGTRANIYRWDNGALIPGTEGIRPGPGVDLSNMDLECARLGILFGGVNLTGASFVDSNLRRALLIRATLDSADLQRANLANANFMLGTFENTWLSGANLKNAIIPSASLDKAHFDSATVYNQWTVFNDDFNPAAAGLTFVESPRGDFDASDALDANDIDWLAAKVRNDDSVSIPAWLDDEMFNVNSDSSINDVDHYVWVKELANTWYGDANFDGEFNTSDFELVLEAGKYETQEYASWIAGDWNGDGRFGTGDLVKALEDGGYESDIWLLGDYNCNGVLELEDIDILTGGFPPLPECDLVRYDLNGDGMVNGDDIKFWAKSKEIGYTWIGDANFDGQFNMHDLLQALAIGKYELPGAAAVWSEGDWNGDGMFGTGDVVAALIDGGYEMGPRTDAVVVPEPRAWGPCLVGMLLLCERRRRRN